MAFNTQQYIMNPKNWKKTHRKVHYAWVCLPPVGTEVKNRATNSPAETAPNHKFVLYTPGRVYKAVSGMHLNMVYTFADGEGITEETIQKKIRNNNVMDWVKVKAKPSNRDELSLVLPTFIKDINGKVKVNAPGRDHLIGDVAVADISPNGTPMLNSMDIVDGQVFPRLYDLHAYQGKYTDEQMNNDVEKPASLISDIVLNENIRSAEHAVDFKNLVNTIADIMYECNVYEYYRGHTKVKWSCNVQKSDILRVKYQKTAAGNLKALIKKIGISHMFPYYAYDIFTMSVIFNQKTKKVMLMYTGEDEKDSKIKLRRMVIDSKYYMHPKFRDALKKVVSQIHPSDYTSRKKDAGDLRHEAMMLNKMFRIMSKPLSGLQAVDKEYSNGHLTEPIRRVNFRSNMGSLMIGYEDGAYIIKLEYYGHAQGLVVKPNMIQRNQRAALTEIAQLIVLYRTTVNTVAIKQDHQGVHNETVERIARILYNRLMKKAIEIIKESEGYSSLGIKPSDFVEAPYIRYEYRNDGACIDMVYYDNYYYKKVTFDITNANGEIKALWRRDGEGSTLTKITSVDSVLSGSLHEIDECFKHCNIDASDQFKKCSGEDNWRKITDLLWEKITGEPFDRESNSTPWNKYGAWLCEGALADSLHKYIEYLGDDGQVFSIIAWDYDVEVRMHLGANDEHVLRLLIPLIPKYGNKFIAVAKQWYSKAIKWVGERYVADIKEGRGMICAEALDRINTLNSIPDSAFYNIGILEHKFPSFFLTESGEFVAYGIPLNTTNDPVTINVDGSQLPIYHDYIAVLYGIHAKAIFSGIRTKVGGYTSKLNGITEEDLRDALAIHDIRDADALAMNNK